MAPQLRLLGALTLAFACGSTAPSSPTAVEERPRIVPDSAPVEVMAVKDIGAVAVPPRPLCTLGPEPWTGSVALRRGGPPFATITSMTSEVSLAADADGCFAVASIDSDVVTLRGVAGPPSLFLKRPTALGGFVIPHAETSFAWDEAPGAANAVTLSLDLTGSFIAPPLLKEQIPCRDVGLTPRRYDPRTLVSAEKHSSVGIVSGDVDLRMSPTTAPIAKTAAGARMAVFVLESNKELSRVLLEMGNGYAFGWIGRNQIITNSFNASRLEISRVGVLHRDVFSNQCDRDLELIAEVGGERGVVGSLRAGAAFEPGVADAAGKLTRVSPTLQWLRLEQGAKLWVWTSELGACRRRDAR